MRGGVRSTRGSAAGRAEHPNHDALVRRDDPLRLRRRAPADDADGGDLRDRVGHGEKLRDRLEGLAEIVLIEAGHDHAQPAGGEHLADLDERSAQELRLVDPDHPRLGVEGIEDLGGRRRRRARGSSGRHERRSSRARDVCRSGFEGLDLLAGDRRAAEAADELLALAAEHAAADDFDLPCRGSRRVAVMAPMLSTARRRRNRQAGEHGTPRAHGAKRNGRKRVIRRSESSSRDREPQRRTTPRSSRPRRRSVAKPRSWPNGSPRPGGRPV